MGMVSCHLRWSWDDKGVIKNNLIRFSKVFPFESRGGKKGRLIDGVGTILQT